MKVKCKRCGLIQEHDDWSFLYIIFAFIPLFWLFLFLIPTFSCKRCGCVHYKEISQEDIIKEKESIRAKEEAQRQREILDEQEARRQREILAKKEAIEQARKQAELAAKALKAKRQKANEFKQSIISRLWAIRKASITEMIIGEDYCVQRASFVLEFALDCALLSDDINMQEIEKIEQKSDIFYGAISIISNDLFYDKECNINHCIRLCEFEIDFLDRIELNDEKLTMQKLKVQNDFYKLVASMTGKKIVDFECALKNIDELRCKMRDITSQSRQIQIKKDKKPIQKSDNNQTFEDKMEQENELIMKIESELDILEILVREKLIFNILGIDNVPQELKNRQAYVKKPFFRYKNMNLNDKFEQIRQLNNQLKSLTDRQKQDREHILGLAKQAKDLLQNNDSYIDIPQTRIPKRDNGFVIYSSRD